MKCKIAEDLSEEIISRLKELISILELKAKEKQNAEKFSNTSLSRN